MGVPGMTVRVSNETNRGSIEVRDSTGPIEAITNRAPIRIDGTVGPLDLETNRAPIDVRKAAGAVHAKTNRAPITVSFSKDPAGEFAHRWLDPKVLFRFRYDHGHQSL